MSRRHRRRKGPPPNAFTKVGVRDNTVLVQEHDGKILDPKDTIDLAKLTEELGGEAPRFKTMPLAAARAFQPKPAAPPPPVELSMGPDKGVKQKISDDTKRLLEKRRRDGETDEMLLTRLADEGVFNTTDPLAEAMRRDIRNHPARRPVTGAPIDESDPAWPTYLKMKSILEALPADKQTRVLEVIKNAYMDPDQDNFFRKVLGIMDHLKPDQQERMMEALRVNDRPEVMKILNERHAAAKDRLWNLEKDVSNIRDKRDALKERLAAIDDIKIMVATPRLEKLGETCFHKCLEAWHTGAIILPLSGPDDFLPPDMRDSLDDHKTVFVVQHDWARAFENAQDFADGEFRLPFNEMVFEFRINGRRVCATTMCKDGDGIPTACMLHIETRVGWALGAAYEIIDRTWKPYIREDDLCGPILELVRQQVRAICIALEAEVAVTEVVRAPHRLNRQRERKGKLPIFDHHVVSLANRKRYQPRDALPGDLEDEHRGKRLHFVRGHWRHYTNSKTWIKWHFRGNPDLGYIDKEYRL